MKYVIADFALNSNMDFYDKIMSQVQDIDIGLVVVNAGVANHGSFLKSGIELHEQTLDVNVY